MARMARVVIPQYPHHVTQRGNRRQKTFFNADDYRYYIQLMSEFSARSGTEVWAYCLMPNHVHLVMVPGDENGLRINRVKSLIYDTRTGSFKSGCSFSNHNSKT